MARNLSNAAASLLPYSTIEAAASGNVDAINAVLKHYERYIRRWKLDALKYTVPISVLQKTIRLQFVLSDSRSSSQGENLLN